MDNGAWTYGPWNMSRALWSMLHPVFSLLAFFRHPFAIMAWVRIWPSLNQLSSLSGILSLQALFLMLYVLGDGPVQHAHSDSKLPDELRSLR